MGFESERRARAGAASRPSTHVEPVSSRPSPSSRPSTPSPAPHKHADARPCPPQELLLSIVWLRDSEQQRKGRTIQRRPQPRISCTSRTAPLRPSARPPWHYRHAKSTCHVGATAGIRELAESTCVTSQPAAGSGCSALARPAALLARAGRSNAQSKWIRSWVSSPD